jgi:hypothetical protein
MTEARLFHCKFALVEQRFAHGRIARGAGQPKNETSAARLNQAVRGARFRWRSRTL